jgi:hypothetical protein
MKLLLAVTLAAAALAALPAAAGAGLVIRADERLAGYRVKADGTLGGAQAAFGRPSRLVRTSSVTCSATWRSLGLRIGFYNLGGLNPCGRRTGHFSNAVAWDERWHTARGLRIGDTSRRLRRLYPAAVYGADGAGRSGWWLVKRRSRVGAGGTYPGLLAVMRQGRVYSFVVRYPAGGD